MRIGGPGPVDPTLPQPPPEGEAGGSGPGSAAPSRGGPTRRQLRPDPMAEVAVRMSEGAGVAKVPEEAWFEGCRYRPAVLDRVLRIYQHGLPGGSLTKAGLLREAKKLDDGNGYLRLEELRAAAVSLWKHADAELAATDPFHARRLGDLPRAEALSLLSERFPGVDFQSILDQADEAMDQSIEEGRILEPSAFEYIERSDHTDGAYDLHVGGRLETWGAEMDFGAVFEIDGTLVTFADMSID